MVDRRTVLTDDECAVMERTDLLALRDYSMSLPTGTTPGKRWRRRTPNSGGWWLGEYGTPEGDRIPVTWRQILLVDECTGLTARWCPNHGDCICSPLPHTDLDNRACPLHGSDSNHADEHTIYGHPTSETP